MKPPRKVQFDCPPVVETVVSVQFEELSAMTTVHLGRFSDRLSDKYPNAVDHQRLTTVHEHFPPVPRIPEISIRSPTFPGRVWLKNESEDQIVQIQPDRIGFNWKKSDNAGYPSFSATFQSFQNVYGMFRKFCEEQNLGEFKPNMCEVIYVNHVSADGLIGDTSLDVMQRCLCGFDLKFSDDWLPPPVGASLNRVFDFDEERLRLYAEVQTIALRDEPKEVMQLKMTSRVMLPGDTEESNVEKAIRLGHNAIVNGFVTLTREDVRRDHWRQNDNTND